MAESIVTLRVEARNAISSLNKTSQATRSLSRNASGATKSLAATSTAAKGLGASLATSLGPLLTIGTAVATVSNAIGTFTARERDVEILRQGLVNLGEGAVTLNTLQEAANRLGNQTLFNQEEFTRGFNLLTSFRNIGVDSYSRVAQAAADIAQVNQVDVSTSFMQLAKALQDPERNLSNLNRSGIAFTKTQTEVIKELMKTNKTAEAHSMILEIVEESYNGLAQAASEGLAGNVDALGETFRDFSETLGKALEPALIASVKGLTELIKAAEALIKSPLGKTIGIFTGIVLAAKGLPVLLTAISAGLTKVAFAGGLATVALNAIPFVAIATAAGILTTALIKTNEEKKKFNDLINKGGEDEVTEQLRKQAKFIGELNRQRDASKGRDKKNIEKKIKEAELDAKMLEGRLQTIKSDKRIEESANKIVALKKDAKESDKETVRLNDVQRKFHEQIIAAAVRERDEELEKTKNLNKFLKKKELETELLQASIDGNREEVELQHAINAAVEIHGEKNRQKITDILTANDGLKNQKKDVDAITEASERQAEVFAEIGRTIGTQITDALVGAINGTKSLGESAKAILNDLANSLLRMGINSMLGGLFGGTKIGGFLGFANGGRPPVGRASVVGEKGPELFVPSTAGTIIPNDRIGGGVTNNIVVNVDASGSNVEGNEQESRELGLVISAAIQAQLVQEKRPGGLLS